MSKNASSQPQNGSTSKNRPQIQNGKFYFSPTFQKVELRKSTFFQSWFNEWMNEWINEWVNGMNNWMNGTNEWMNKWMNEWMNEWMKKSNGQTRS